MDDISLFPYFTAGEISFDYMHKIDLDVVKESLNRLYKGKLTDKNFTIIDENTLKLEVTPFTGGWRHEIDSLAAIRGISLIYCRIKDDAGKQKIEYSFSSNSYNLVHILLVVIAIPFLIFDIRVGGFFLIFIVFSYVSLLSADKFMLQKFLKDSFYDPDC